MVDQATFNYFTIDLQWYHFSKTPIRLLKNVISFDDSYKAGQIDRPRTLGIVLAIFRTKNRGVNFLEKRDEIFRKKGSGIEPQRVELIKSLGKSYGGSTKMTTAGTPNRAKAGMMQS